MSYSNLNPNRFMLHPLRKCRARTQQPHRCFHNRLYKEDSRWPGWQVVIGIETHAQIRSRRKLFSESLASEPGEPPNAHVSLFDAAFPGTLPILNHKCVDLALRTAMALECDIQKHSSFDRKHYFYSDLPAGYQITQQYAPIARGGRLPIQVPNALPFVVRIKQIQLEQDTAKSTFMPRTRTSHIDLNRAGIGLMEVVSEPDLRSPEEAGAYVRTLQAVLRAVGSSDGNMEQGSLRCDVNVSVNRFGCHPGTRCEIKNLNSVRFMMAAITHEVNRQRAILESAADAETATIPQETRGFDENRFETYKLRSKEDAPDYRYMPDPNLGILSLDDSRIQNIRDSLPELPWETRHRLEEIYGLSERDIDVLLNVESRREVRYDGEPGDSAVSFFDRLCAMQGATNASRRDPKVVVNWMIHDLLGQLASRKETFRDNHLSAEQFGELIDLVEDKAITRTCGKFLLRYMLTNPSQISTRRIADDLQLTPLSRDSSNLSRNPHVSASASASATGSSELHALCSEAIAALPEEVVAVRKGNKNVLNKIVGRVMKDSRGRADAEAVKALLENLITSC